MATFEIPADTPPERHEQIAAEVKRRLSEGGPEGVQRVMIFVDRDRNMARGVTFFDTKEHMDAAEAFFEGMTPVNADEGARRTDVGHFEVILDHQLTTA